MKKLAPSLLLLICLLCLFSCGLPDSTVLLPPVAERDTVDPIGLTEEIVFTVPLPDRIELLGVDIYYKIYDVYPNENTLMETDQTTIDNNYITGAVSLNNIGFYKAQNLLNFSLSGYTIDLQENPGILAFSIDPDSLDHLILELAGGTSYELGRLGTNTENPVDFTDYDFSLTNATLCDLDLRDLQARVSAAGSSPSAITISFAAFVIGMDPGNLGVRIESTPTYLGAWTFINFIE